MTRPAPGAIAAAYRHCEEITWRRARNFSYGIRLLPAPKRQALAAVYAAARRIDDIGDGSLPPEQKLARLGEARAALRRLPGSGGDGDPVLAALADAARRMPIPLPAYDELIDGCESDVVGRRYQDEAGLVWYCRAVAGSIGRLSLGVFGADRPSRAAPLADALGVALQLTNIVRDLREDAAAGRRYLPEAQLRRFGCTLRLASDGAGFSDPPGGLSALVRHHAAWAQRWYETGLRLLPLLDRRSAACAAAMAGIYRRLLHRIAEDPLSVTHRRVSLPAREKAWVAGRALIGFPP